MKRFKLFLILMAVALTATACQKGQKEIPEEKNSADITREEDTDESDPEEMDQDSADAILEEKLQGTECRAIFSEYRDVDGVDVYLYSVVNKDERELDQMLAVNAISGEVVVYNPDTDKLLGYDRFEYYVDDGDNPVSWDSEYYLEPRTVELMPADDNSFEFTITKDEESEPELSGVAEVKPGSKREALYEDDKLSLTFVNQGSTLEIRDNGNISGLAGIYERQE